MKYIIICLFLSACGSKINSTPVANFDVEKYLGKWYEIARTDNKFEKGCNDVTATYSLRNDGGIDVVNRCIANGKEKTAKGRAYFRENPTIGALKVTFFWPFYGSYNIAYLDENYQFALVDGGSKKYLWILSRTKTMKQEDTQTLLNKAKESGFDVGNLVYPSHQ